MELMYRSTRDSKERVTASRAIINGLASHGGLYVPEYFPKLTISLSEMATMTYQEVAYEVMRLFFTDFTKEELTACINSAYDSKFDTKEIVPIKKVGNTYYLELFHGPTIAFKDMALSILPYLMTTAARKNQITEEIVILTATSGDTGKAALAGFADVPGTKIIVFYPKEGVSSIQEKQMVTQKGDNTYVIGIRGNFDDAQTGVKKLFADSSLSDEMKKKGYRFSSANSINIGRLVPQIVYYIYAYTRLLANGELKEGEKVNVCVPTGNFGNILAAYYAEKIGLPVHRFLCASNQNHVLTDFFTTGTYDRNRPFYLTSSPSMDILVSSNLERLLYTVASCDEGMSNELMTELSQVGHYSITSEMKEQMSEFRAGYAQEQEVKETIALLEKEAGYVIDPHTAVAASVYRNYQADDNDQTKTLLASTASPYKFASSVLEALGQNCDTNDDFVLAEKLRQISKVPIPEAVVVLKNAPILHKMVCDKQEMEKTVRELLKL